MKKFAQSLFIPLIGVLFLYAFHFNTHVDTMLNKWNEKDLKEMRQIDQQALFEAVDYHKQEPAFARRPLSTFLFERTSAILKWPIGTSFILVNFLLLFLCGIALYFLCIQLDYSVLESIFSQLLFYSGFTILCAFFNTNYTYDEPLTYFFFLISMLAFFKKKYVLFFLLFLFSCVCRESMYLFAPVFLFSIWNHSSDKPKLKMIHLFVVGFVFVILFHAFFLHLVYPNFFTSHTHQELSSRMNLFDFNFQDIKYTRETILSFFLVNALPLYLIIQYWNEIRLNKMESTLLYGFVFLLLINSFIVIFSTIARESRLFAIPLLLIYPMLGRYFLNDIRHFFKITTFRFSFHASILLLLNIVILFVAHWYFFSVYETTIHPKQFNFNAEYLFAIVLVIVLLNCKYLLTSKSQPTVDPGIYT